MDKNNLPDNLIDLALQIGDKEWFNKLCGLSKENDIEKEEYIKWSDIERESNIIIASDNLTSNTVYLLESNSVRLAINKSDVEQSELVMVYSINGKDDIKIGEEVNIEYLDEEWEIFWRNYYTYIFDIIETKDNQYQELVDTYTELYMKHNDLENKCDKLKEISKEKDDIINKYIDIISGYQQVIKDYKNTYLNKKKWWKFWL